MNYELKDYNLRVPTTTICFVNKFKNLIQLRMEESTITRPEFFNPIGAGGTCLFNQAEDLRGLRRIKGPMKWCNLRSDFTNEFTVALADSWRKVCALRCERAGWLAVFNPRFDPEQERFFGLKSTLLFMSDMFWTTTAIEIHESEALSILNERFAVASYASRSQISFPTIYSRIYNSRNVEWIICIFDNKFC